MWATIIIAESFTRIMGSTVPSSDRRRCFLQYNFMDPGWGENFLRGEAPWPSRWRCLYLIYVAAVTEITRRPV